VTSWRRRLLRAWVLLALAWIAGVAYVCVPMWPSMPLDMSANDPATREVFAHAVRMHAARCAGLALMPPLAVLAIGWLVSRLAPARS
jgi:hypothetical protein